MIDNDGYRPNVGIVICNRHGQVLWARRNGQNSWQFPQGGINQNESPEQAMFRELNEEVGLTPKDVKILSVTTGWLRYKLPKRMIRWENTPVCIGQKQKWFLLELVSDKSAINLTVSPTPEFDDWRWVSYWYPIRQVIAFKRDVYRKAMKEFAATVFGIQIMQNIEDIPVQQVTQPSKPYEQNNRQNRPTKQRLNFFARKRHNRNRNTEKA
ncbi:RNA pyrophosphohydrolase [Zophobihabitans entericus]|uniref:RNA pyrophosphohydrolase n=1 Tax=Zophobihabitans entericus TaxID=1635327 RepID=A0A6G9I9Z7_9GAMM|nr:RNA pyrophosphohydrolase [Zophobihabitans entericus]QIQ20657.1 RNA pyrophosphohydrolase [Zophobihabitans entericus]